MRKIFLTVALFASLVFAGERYLGTIRASGNASATNRTTTNPFMITGPVKLTLYCPDARPFVCTDSTTCTTDGGTAHGFKMPSEYLPTSINYQTQDASIAIVDFLDAGCQVFSRAGNE